jgi:hypothetical protein
VATHEQDSRQGTGSAVAKHADLRTVVDRIFYITKTGAVAL